MSYTQLKENLKQGDLRGQGPLSGESLGENPVSVQYHLWLSRNKVRGNLDYPAEKTGSILAALSLKQELELELEDGLKIGILVAKSGTQGRPRAFVLVRQKS